MTVLKTCTRCGLSKEKTEFNLHLGATRAQCRECQKKQGKEYYLRNKETVLARTRAYARAHPEIKNAECKSWNDRNPEKSRARYLRHRHKDIEASRAKDRAWRRRNLGHDAAKSANRRAAKKHRTPPWVTKEMFDQIKKFYVAAAQLSQLSSMPYHVDHIVPLRGKLVSGLNVPWNLSILSRTENLLKKNDFDPLSYVHELLPRTEAVALTERVRRELELNNIVDGSVTNG